MKKLLFIIPLFACLCSCSPHKQLARLLEKHPELHRDSTIIYHDTIVMPGIEEHIFITYEQMDSLKAEASTTQNQAQNSSTAVSVVAGKASASLAATDKGVWLTAKQAGDTVFVEVEKQVPVYLTEKQIVEKPLSKWQHFCIRMGWIFIVLILIGSVFQLIKLYNKLKNKKL